MAVVLTLDGTPRGEESCSFSCSAEPAEVPADDGDTGDRTGLTWSGMEGYFGHADIGDPNPPRPLPEDRLPRRLPPSKLHCRQCLRLRICLCTTVAPVAPPWVPKGPVERGWPVFSSDPPKCYPNNSCTAIK